LLAKTSGADSREPSLRRVPVVVHPDDASQMRGPSLLDHRITRAYLARDDRILSLALTGGLSRSDIARDRAE
jgi:hypothetical protein